MLIRNDHTGIITYRPPYDYTKLYRLKLDWGDWITARYYDQRGWNWKLYNWLKKKGNVG